MMLELIIDDLLETSPMSLNSPGKRWRRGFVNAVITYQEERSRRQECDMRSLDTAPPSECGTRGNFNEAGHVITLSRASYRSARSDFEGNKFER